MALVIHMKKKQRIIINGAVLENVSGKTVSIAVRSQAAVLRSEDVLTGGRGGHAGQPRLFRPAVRVPVSCEQG